jgi:hypothetical protein
MQATGMEAGMAGNWVQVTIDHLVDNNPCVSCELLLLLLQIRNQPHLGCCLHATPPPVPNDACVCIGVIVMHSTCTALACSLV